MMAAIMVLAASVTVSAKKKEEVEILFGVKSGIVTISQDMGDFEMPDFGAMGGGMGRPEGMGGPGGGMQSFNMSDMSEKIYFDDYGRKTARVTTYGERVTRTITIADSTYTINDTENTATVNPTFGSRRGNRGGMGGGFGMGMMGGGASVGVIGTIDWLNLDKKVIKKNKIKELGESTVAGVKCKMYSYRITNAQMGMTSNVTISVYNGVPLETVTESDWSTMTTTAVAFQEVDVPASMFELPEGCVVSQPQMRDFGGMGGFGGDFGGDFGGFGGGMGGFGGGMGGFGGF